MRKSRNESSIIIQVIRWGTASTQLTNEYHNYASILSRPFLAIPFRRFYGIMRFPTLANFRSYLIFHCFLIRAINFFCLASARYHAGVVQTYPTLSHVAVAVAVVVGKTRLQAKCGSNRYLTYMLQICNKV